jgi:hypothetical protein
MPTSDRKGAFQRYYAKHKYDLNARRREKYAMKKIKKIADEQSSVPDESSSAPDVGTPIIVNESIQWFEEMSRRVWRQTLEKRFQEELDKGIGRLNNKCGETLDPEPLKFVDRITTWSY